MQLATITTTSILSDKASDLSSQGNSNNNNIETSKVNTNNISQINTNNIVKNKISNNISSNNNNNNLSPVGAAAPPQPPPPKSPQPSAQPNTHKLSHRRTNSAALAAQSDLNLSFCGCGFLGIYHVGVASCFHEYAPQLSMHKISGSSAGALVAVSHICGNLQLAYATTDILRVAIEARARALGPFHPSFDIQALVREALERGLPGDVHEKATGKLHVSLTRVEDGANVIVNQFDSKEDVIQVLLCSCFIPFWSGLKPPKYKGVTYVDGGFSNNLLILDDKTVKVSPFAGEADICPQDDNFNLLQVNLSNTSFSLSADNLYRLSHALLPPPPEVLSKLCEQGFADGIRYLQRMKLISCTKCLEIRSSLLVTTNGGDMEEAFVSAEADKGAVSSKSNCKIRTNTIANSNTTKNNNTNSNIYGHQKESKQHYPNHPNADTISYTSSISGLLESPAHSIRLEQQEQKMIEITEDRNSFVSTKSQRFHSSQAKSTTTTKTTTTVSSTSMCQQKPVRKMYQSSVSLHSSVSETIVISEFGRDDDDDDSDDHFGTTTSNNNNNLDDDYGDDDDDENTMDLDDELNCDECAQIRLQASSLPLPKQFSDRIREACDTVNKSLYNWLCSHRPIKYLAYLMAPYYLPIDVTLALVFKCWQRMPEIRSELIECIYKLVDFLIGMLRRMPTSKSTSALLMGSSSSSSSSSSSASLSASSKSLSTPMHWEKAAEEYEKELLQKVGAPVGKEQVPNTPNESTDDHHRSPNSSDLQLASSNISHSQQHTHSPHSLEDTFDSIVDVTSRQEARIFAYYFRDAKNRLQVTEIFDLERVGSQHNSIAANGNLSLA